MIRYAQKCDGKFALEVASQSERKSDKSMALLPFQKRHFPGGRGGGALPPVAWARKILIYYRLKSE